MVHEVKRIYQGVYLIGFLSLITGDVKSSGCFVFSIRSVVYISLEMFHVIVVGYMIDLIITL